MQRYKRVASTPRRDLKPFKHWMCLARSWILLGQSYPALHVKCLKHRKAPKMPAGNSVWPKPSRAGVEPAHLSALSLSPSMKGQADAPPASALWDLDVALTKASLNYSEATFQVKMKRNENLDPVSRGSTLNPHGSPRVPAHSSKASPCSTGSSHSTKAWPRFQQLLSKFKCSSAALAQCGCDTDWCLGSPWIHSLPSQSFSVSLIPSSNKWLGGTYI